MQRLTDADAITPAWLTARLRQKSHLPTGAVEAVAVGEPFESTAAFWTPLKLRFTPGTPLSAPTDLLFKRYRKDGFGGGVHEITFYETFVAAMEDPPVAACYDADCDETERTCYLLLEDLTGKYTSGKQGTTEAQYAMAVRALLEFHTYWWEHAALNDDHFMTYFPLPAGTSCPGRGGSFRISQICCCTGRSFG